MDDLFDVKYTKMLSFSLVAEALTGLIYYRPSGENSNFQFSCRICRVEDETLEHIFQCKAYEKELNLGSDFSHLWIYSDDVDKISKRVEIIGNILDV